MHNDEATIGGFQSFSSPSLSLILFFSFSFLFVFFCIIYGFGDWVSLKTGIWVSGCGNLEALVAFSFGGYGFGDLVVAFKYGGCGLCLKFPVDLVSVVLERENDGEAEREERDWC